MPEARLEILVLAAAAGAENAFPALVIPLRHDLNDGSGSGGSVVGYWVVVMMMMMVGLICFCAVG